MNENLWISVVKEESYILLIFQELLRAEPRVSQCQIDKVKLPITGINNLRGRFGH